MLHPFTYVKATSVSQAVRELQAENAAVLGGGSDLITVLREGIEPVEKVVSISELSELREIAPGSDGGLRVGGLAVLTDIAAHETILERFPALAQGASEVGSPQIRNQGTIAGNICQKPRCWYYRGNFDCIRKGGATCYAVGGENQFHCILGGAGCYIVHPSDTAPALTAYGAVVTAVGPNGDRTLHMDEFFADPADDPTRETMLEQGEVITEITLPAWPKTTYSSYRKVRARRSWDFALAGAALALDMDGDTVRTARIVLSGAAPYPWRSRSAEEAVTGKKLTPQNAREAARAAMAEARPMSQNGYKIPLFEGMLEEELLKAAG